MGSSLTAPFSSAPVGSTVRQAAHTFVVRGLTFSCRAALVVILAKLLRPDDYGAYALVTTITTFGIVLAGLSLHTYVFRAVPGRPPEEQLQIFKATSIFEFLSTLALVVFVAASGLLGVALTALRASEHASAFTVGLLLLLLLVPLAEASHFLLAQSRVEQANWVDFFSQAAWVLPLGALAMLRIPIGLRGILLTQLGGCVIALVYAAVQIGPSAWWRARPDWRVLRGGLAYSIPMVIPPLALYSLKLADRFFLSHYHTLQQVGIYSFAYTLVNTAYTFTAWIAFTTMGPRIIRAHNNGSYRERDVLQTYTVKVALVSFIGAVVVMLLLADPLVRFAARPEYLAARQPLPLLSVAYVFMILTFPAQYALMMDKRMVVMVTIDLIGMAVGIALDFWLIPIWSYNGAAVASAIGFAVVLIGKYSCSSALTFREFARP